MSKSGYDREKNYLYQQKFRKSYDVCSVTLPTGLKTIFTDFAKEQNLTYSGILYRALHESKYWEVAEQEGFVFDDTFGVRK